jgi:spore photoproduct lyase
LLHRRFPLSRIAAFEMVRAPDGKLRYFKDLRVEMYGRMRKWLEEALPGAFVYLCMESPRVWQAVWGWSPGEEDLARLLDDRVIPKMQEEKNLTQKRKDAKTLRN